MRNRLRRIWIVVFLLPIGVVFSAQAAELRIEKIFTQADGLASDIVLAVFEDRQGNMWFGTAEGLTRYDGERFQTFTTKDGLASNAIGLIFEDQQGILWFGSGRLSNFSEEGTTVDMSLMAMSLSDLAKLPLEERIEETTSSVQPKGVSRYDGREFQIFTTANGLAGNTIKTIFEDETGILWFATGLGVSRYDGEKFDQFSINGPIGMDVLPEWWGRVRAIAQDTAGSFWFGSDAGITYYNAQTRRFRYFAVDEDFKPFEEMGQDRSGHISALQFDTKGHLWIGRTGLYEEDSGLRQYDGKKLISFPTSEELPITEVDSIQQDSKGNLWFVGAKKLPPTLRETEDSTHMIYPEVGTGVSVYNGKTFQNFNTADGLSSDFVRAVFEASDRKLWFATNAGVAVGIYLH